MSTATKISKDVIFSNNGENEVNIMFLSDDDDNVYNLEGTLAKVFVQITEEKSPDELKTYIKTSYPDKTDEDIEKFLGDFLKNLKSLNILV